MNREIVNLARFLEDAELGRYDVRKLVENHPQMTVQNGYEIQYEIVKSKLEQGYTLLGYKLGLTSAAKMEQMNVSEPIYGHLFDYMALQSPKLPFDELIHPRVEPEIAYIMGEDTAGDYSLEGMEQRIAWVCPAIEVVDSRYRNFDFTLCDVIADNSSSSRFILGEKVPMPKGGDLSQVAVSLAINGEVVGRGVGGDVLGHPTEALCMLSRILGERGEIIPKGAVVLTGGITKAYQVYTGDEVRAEIDSLGSTGFTVV